MTNRKDIRDLLTRLFSEQRLAILATDNQGQPHTSLMTFAVEKDLKSFVLATRCDTKKHEYLLSNTRVSMLVDNRSGGFRNPQDTLSVTIMGKAEVMEGSEREKARELYLDVLPELLSSNEESNYAIWRIRVISYQVVKGLDTLDVWRLEEESSRTSSD